MQLAALPWTVLVLVTFIRRSIQSCNTKNTTVCELYCRNSNSEEVQKALKKHLQGENGCVLKNVKFEYTSFPQNLSDFEDAFYSTTSVKIGYASSSSHVTEFLKLNLPSLEYLTIYNVNLSFISDDFFQNNPKLKRLEIRDASINAISDGAFQNMSSSLEDLSLVGNYLSKIPNAIVGLRQLRSLYLERNNLSYLNTVLDLPSLEQLFLSNNRIQSFEEDVFTRLPNLKQLFLNGNLLRAFPRKNPFINCAHLTLVHLMANQLEGCLDDRYCTSTVEYLDISFNKINKIHKCVLKDCNNLKTLKLANNSFTTLSRLYYCENLQELSLDKNELENIEACIFSDCTSLKKVHLENNRIVFFDRLAFRNNILQSLEELHVQGNPFNCTCQLQWLKSFYSTDHEILNELYCANDNNKSFNTVDFCPESSTSSNSTSPTETVHYEIVPFEDLSCEVTLPTDQCHSPSPAPRVTTPVTRQTPTVTQPSEPSFTHIETLPPRTKDYTLISTTQSVSQVTATKETLLPFTDIHVSKSTTQVTSITKLPSSTPSPMTTSIPTVEVTSAKQTTRETLIPTTIETPPSPSNPDDSVSTADPTLSKPSTQTSSIPGIRTTSPKATEETLYPSSETVSTRTTTFLRTSPTSTVHTTTSLSTLTSSDSSDSSTEMYNSSTTELLLCLETIQFDNSECKDKDGNVCIVTMTWNCSDNISSLTIFKFSKSAFQVKSMDLSQGQHIIKINRSCDHSVCVSNLGESCSCTDSNKNCFAFAPVPKEENDKVMYVVVIGASLTIVFCALIASSAYFYLRYSKTRKKSSFYSNRPPEPLPRPSFTFIETYLRNVTEQNRSGSIDSSHYTSILDSFRSSQSSSSSQGSSSLISNLSAQSAWMNIRNCDTLVDYLELIPEIIYGSSGMDNQTFQNVDEVFCSRL